MKMFKKGQRKETINYAYQSMDKGSSHHYLQYQSHRTCSICGAELSRSSIRICDGCAKFLRQKHIADL